MSDKPAIAPDQGQRWDTLVLGIGNVLWADEGFGVRAVEHLHSRFEFPNSVRLMDGGTQGIFLLPWVRAARRLLIFDAIDFGLPPSTLRLICGKDVPSYMGAKKVSMHQAGFQEVLSSAQLAGEFPADIALIGVQPAVLDDYGGSLTSAVREQLVPAITVARRVLKDWGITARARQRVPRSDELIGPDPVGIGGYESGRPVLE